MKVYLDFDNTMVRTSAKVVEMLNERYGTDKKESDIIDYNFSTIRKMTVEERLGLFEDDAFFTDLQFKPGVLQVIDKYYDMFDWAIVTKGTAVNIEKKFCWIKENIPYDMELIGLDLSSHSKAKVDMRGGIHIDDHMGSLDTNADVRILYKDYTNYDWQQVPVGEDVLVLNSWEEVDQVLNFNLEYDYKTLERKE